MSAATDMPEEPAPAHEIPAAPWNVVPRDGGSEAWLVYDGDQPVPVAEFTSKSDAVAFAWHKTLEPSSHADVGPRSVVVHPRPESRAGGTADAPRRPRQFGSSRGKVRMAPDFDEWPPEYKEFFG